MAYAALQDMIDRYGQQEMIQLTSGKTEPVEGPATLALGDASALIDSYVGGRYQLPLTPVPDPVPRWCCDIARFYLWRDNASESVTALYKSAIAALNLIQQGSLLLEAAAVDTPTTGDVIQLEGPPRQFGRRSLGYF